KLIALIIIFLVTFFGTLLPIKVTKYFERQGRKGLVLISYMMCFGGGVFFAIYLLHMSPDVHQIMNYAIIQPYHITYPLTELIISAGFFIMLFMEKIIQKASKKSSPNSEPVPKTTYVEVSKGDDDHNMRMTRSLVLLMALSLHHIFEGMTVGLKHTEMGVWNMCIAIVSHEVVVGFSLGLQLLRSYNTVKKVVIAALLCALMTPLGVIIGMSVMETGGEGNMSLDAANGILQGIATGVFIYVTFFEILYGEI
ncbi:Zinc transporter ZIP1, partial [Lamellibrachia satsuma]